MLRPTARPHPALLLVMLAAACPAAAADAPAKPADPPAPSLHKAKLVPFRVEARIEGIFESPAMAEVRLEPKRWSQFVVAEAVPHGTRVGKGDVIVKIETDKLDEAIQDQEIGGRTAALAHALMERELAALAKSTPRQLEIARRARRIAEENRKRYEDKERELATATNDYSLAWSKQTRENAEEELAQLEQMYEQDDLTEETEAIVLKRARFQAELYRFFERLAKDEHERAATLDLPRALESVRLAAEAAVLDNERAEASLPLALDKLRLELEKSAHERRKAAEQLAELKADRQGLPITAPTDGVVYYGRWRQGKWIDGDAAAQRLRPGGQLDPRETVITVVGPGKLSLRAIVAEKDLGRVPVAAAARILPRAFPEPPLAGRVRSVASVPVGPGRFEAMIDLVDDAPRLVAGMEADVRVTADQRAEVLAVPRKAVFTDDFDDGRRYVLVFAGAGKEPMKRSVVVGRSNDELTEITAGLSVGEEILLDKPSPAAAKQEASAAKAEPAKPEAAKPDAAAAPTKESTDKPAAPATKD